MTATPSQTLPPDECSSWCRRSKKGDGHTYGKHLDGQDCCSQGRVVTLSHQPVLEVGARTRIHDHLTAHVHRDAGAANAYVSVAHNDLSAFDLSPDEARQLSTLLRHAKTAGEYDLHPGHDAGAVCEANEPGHPGGHCRK